MTTKMKRKVSILGVILMILLSGNFVQAQPGDHPGPPPVPDTQQIQNIVAEVSSKLSLSEAQKTQVSKLYIAHFEEVSAKTKTGRLERKEMEALENKFEKEVNKVLTSEQKKLFAAYQEKNRLPQSRGKRPSK